MSVENLRTTKNMSSESAKPKPKLELVPKLKSVSRFEWLKEDLNREPNILGPGDYLCITTPDTSEKETEKVDATDINIPEDNLVISGGIIDNLVINGAIIDMGRKDGALYCVLEQYPINNPEKGRTTITKYIPGSEKVEPIDTIENKDTKKIVHIEAEEDELRPYEEVDTSAVEGVSIKIKNSDKKTILISNNNSRLVAKVFILK